MAKIASSCLWTAPKFTFYAKQFFKYMNHSWNQSYFKRELQYWKKMQYYFPESIFPRKHFNSLYLLKSWPVFCCFDSFLDNVWTFKFYSQYPHYKIFTRGISMYSLNEILTGKSIDWYHFHIYILTQFILYVWKYSKYMLNISM